ncbi:hnRNP A1-gamma isoform [Lyophyllum atratum]|nr:hnRNP A1-gamma isoform [Lyophyllum atratum]
MSRATLDSDLYGDIYGDDDPDYPQTETADDEEPTDEPETPTETPPPAVNEPTTQPAKPPPTSQDALRSLPPKPMSPNSLSYSAQIAQQFSAYQQTPSQERQQRAEIPLPQNPRTTVGAPIASITTREDTSSTDSVFGKKPSEMHDSGKLFIGGLNWDTTDEGLRNYFSQFGKVDACTIMRDPSGTSRGFAFMTFEDADAVNAVVARDHILDGKSIDPKRAIPREEHLRNTRYFVGGLSPSTTSDSMKEFFSAYGKVVDATVMVDRESGRSKGFGFVTYEDASNADQLVGKIGLILDDKQIEVKMAQPRSQRDQARATASPTTSGRDSAFPSQTAQSMASAMVFAPQQQQQQQPNQMSMMFQRPMGQVPMMNANMPMMNVNPMAMAAMGMGMGGFNPMAGMNGMNNMGAMNGMANMNAMSGMGNMGAMRLGMGPMGMGGTGMGTAGMGAGMTGTGMGTGAMGGMNAMGMGMRQNMTGMGGGAVNPNFGRMAMNAATAGPGPARVTSRGQHSFHPYSR